jgi:hypothetical protein
MISRGSYSLTLSGTLVLLDHLLSWTFPINGVVLVLMLLLIF